MQPKRIKPKAGQESVWDYPRPPRIERTDKRIRVVFDGVTIADTTQGLRVLETSHPPGIYIPQTAIRMEILRPTAHQTFCEFKGAAAYWDLQHGEHHVAQVAWCYPNPTSGYAQIKDYLSFYPGRIDACFINDEQVQPQAGNFYGGWITREIVGPFKGEPGTRFW